MPDPWQQETASASEQAEGAVGRQTGFSTPPLAAAVGRQGLSVRQTPSGAQTLMESDRKAGGAAEA